MKTRSKIRIPMPARYVINLALVVGFYFLLTGLISSGVITNYWTGILITVGINIILAVSLNIATGYLGQLPLGHAGFMAVGAYAGGIFMKATPAAALLKEGNNAALIPYILAAIVISAIVAGIFGIIIGIPALRLRGDYLAIITLGFGEIIRVVLTNIDSVLGFDFTYGAAGLKRIPKFSSVTLVFICVVLSCFFIHTMMKSKHGRAILSIRDNEIASESVGVNTTYYKTMAFVFSAMLAGIAGCSVALLGSIDSTVGQSYIVNSFMAVVLGGVGKLLGTAIGSVIIGSASIFTENYTSSTIAKAIVLLIVIIFLQKRPQGLFVIKSRNLDE